MNGYARYAGYAGYGLVVLTLACALAAPVAAQAPGQRGKVMITITDPSGAIIPGATVTLVGLETATKAVAIPAKTDEKGAATFDGVAPGRYSVRGEFPGFELGLLRDVRVRAGDNKHVVVLPLKQMTESVTVAQDQRAVASARATLGLALTREQIEALSDDPDEMQRQLQDLAGPNAKFRVDSFEGGQLPPKAQIKSIHITRDQYAAESHYIGGTFVEIVTQPGVGALRGSGSLNFNDGSMNGRNAFAPKKGPEQARRYGFSLGGTLAKRKADFSVNFNGSNAYSTPILRAALPTGTQSANADLRTPRDTYGFGGTLNYALTRDQTIRVTFSQSRNTANNLGVGDLSQPTRAYSTEGHGYNLMLQEAGPLGRRLFTNTRAYLRWNDTSSHSFIEAPAIVVNGAFTTGGAQRTGGSHQKYFTINSDLDYVRGIQSWRAGVQIEAWGYRSNDATNYLGTYTFTSNENYLAGRPAFYTRQVGDPNIRYWNVQTGLYLQDDIRISKGLSVSPGIRYEAQNHVRDYNSVGPRFGITWAPFKSGKTTVRLGGGLFYNWLNSATRAQTIRLDGTHQQELTIVNPTFPDPGSTGTIRASNRYLIGADYQVPKNAGWSVTVEQTITPRIRGYFSYNYSRARGLPRGTNLNLPVNGIRPNPAFANIIETVSDGASRGHSINASLSMSLLAPSPAANRARFNWKRLSLSAYYTRDASESNAEGAFSVPPNGTLETEWGPSYSPNYFSLSLNSSQVRNLGAGISLNVSSGYPYNITTGIDANGDLVLNDRPAGLGRNTGRNPGTVNSSARLSYSWGLGKSTSSTAASSPLGVPIMVMNGVVMSAVSGGAAGPSRYRIGISASVQNPTNHVNLSGVSGVMTSPFFGKPQSAGTPRRIDLAMTFSF